MVTHRFILPVNRTLRNNQCVLLRIHPLQLIGSEWHLFSSRLKKCYYFVIIPEAVANIYKVTCKKVIAAFHQPDEYVQEVDAIKYNSIILDILLYIIAKRHGMLCPVHCLLNMM